MDILFLGDIVGRPGRKALAVQIKNLRAELGLDAVIANAENASGGIGINARAARELLCLPVDALTSGNLAHPPDKIIAAIDDDVMATVSASQFRFLISANRTDHLRSQCACPLAEN